MRRALGLLAAGLLLLAGPAGAELTTVDVLALYTPGAAERYGGAGGVRARIEHVTAVANQIYEDSGALLRLRVVHAQEVAYDDAAASGTALEDLTLPGAPLHEEAAWLRDAYGADLTVLLRPYAGDGLCGLAWLGGYQSGGVLRAWDADYAFSHVSVDCSDYVLAHELGHNMGLAHSRRQSPQGGTFPWAAGHGVDGLFTTVMAYASAFGAPKLYRFSSPALDCLGVPCGVDAAEPERGADAVRTLETVRAQIAGYRDAALPDVRQPASPEEVAGGEVAPGASGEVRLLHPTRRRRLRAGEETVIQWASADVEWVEVSWRASWKEGRRRVESADWTSIGSAPGPILRWTPPDVPGRRARIQLRLVGRDGWGRAVAERASPRLRLRPRR